MELGQTVSDFNDGSFTDEKFDIDTVCNATNVSANKDITDDIKNIAKISENDTEVTCNATRQVKVHGKGQFDGQDDYTITYDGSSFTTAKVETTQSGD